MAVAWEMEPLTRKSLKRRVVNPRLDSGPQAGVEGRGVTEGVSMGVEEVEGARGSWATWGFFAGLRRLAGGTIPEGGRRVFCCCWFISGAEGIEANVERGAPLHFFVREVKRQVLFDARCYFAMTTTTAAAEDASEGV